MELTLYSYRRYSKYTREMLKKSSFWLSSPKEFNDPYDCCFSIYSDNVNSTESTNILARINQLVKPSVLSITNLPALANRIHALLRSFGVFCFSEVWDSILMWTHYTDKHKGLCLGFTFDTDLLPKLLPPPQTLNDVRYSTHYPRLHVRDFAYSTLKAVQEGLLTKAFAWHYEQEWRLIGPKASSEIGWPFPLTRVIFGHLLEEKRRKRIWNILRNRQGINFYVAVPSKRTFQLELKPWQPTNKKKSPVGLTP